MEEQYICLKKYCRDRNTRAVTPSLTQMVFPLDDFKSQDFVDKITNYHLSKEHQSKSEGDHFNKQLFNVIHNINEEFEKLKKKIDRFKLEWTKKVLAYLTNDDKTEELDSIKLEIKNCHNKILQNNLNPLLIEEFVRLLAKHKQVATQPEIESKKQKTETIYKVLENFTQEINSNIDKYAKIVSLESLQPFPISKNPNKNPEYEQREILELKNKKEVQNEGIVFELNKKKFFFFVSAKTPVSDNKENYEIVSLHVKRPPFTKRAVENISHARGRAFCYVKSLNSIIVQDTKNYTLNLYRLSSKGMKRYAAIPIGITSGNNVTRLLGLADKVTFEFIDPHRLIAIASDFYLKLVNIFTRRVEFEKTFDEKICDINYMPEINFFAVLLVNGKIIVFEVLGAGTLMYQKHIITTDVTDVPVKIFSAGNIILIHERAQCEHPIDETKTFHLFKVNDAEVKNFKIVLSFDLRVPNVVILPLQEKVKICYYPAFSEVKIHTYDFGKDKHEGEEEGLIMWGNEDLFVIIKDEKLILKQKKVEDRRDNSVL